MIEIWRIEKGNAAGRLAQCIGTNGDDLPPALPWVEPSLNNLWLEACNSHLCGNYQASIITTSILLELSLRMALANLEDVPSIRDDHGDMFEKDALSSIINAAKRLGILSGDSKKWWEAYCSHIRNKICHGDLLHILDDCRSVAQFADYFNPIESHAGEASYTYECILTHPAAFHHKTGRRFSKHFLHDSYNELDDLLGKTGWTEYDEWWESQKTAYESFFAFRWNYSTLMEGIRAIRIPLGSSAS